MCKIFKENFLNITIECNLAITNFLDVTFDLKSGTFYLYRKENNDTLYIHKQSNHPVIILIKLDLITIPLSEKVASMKV